MTRGSLRGRTALFAAALALLAGCDGGGSGDDDSDGNGAGEPTADAPVLEFRKVQARLAEGEEVEVIDENAPDVGVRALDGLSCALTPEFLDDAGFPGLIVTCDDEGTRYLLGPVEFTGKAVDAEASLPMDGSWGVSLELDDAGAAGLFELTTELAETFQPVAVMLDGQVLTAPSVGTPLEGGDIHIAGDFTEESAEDLAEDLTGD